MVFNFPEPKNLGNRHDVLLKDPVWSQCERIARERRVQISEAIGILLEGAIAEYDAVYGQGAMALPTVVKEQMENVEEQSQEVKKIAIKELDSLDAEPEKKIRKCDNPKCPWPNELHDPDNMTDFKDKKCCILACAEDMSRAAGEAPHAFLKGVKQKGKKRIKGWSRKYPDGCRVCGSDKKRHMGGGLCSGCYFKKP